jgi:hypothetical protein
MGPILPPPPHHHPDIAPYQLYSRVRQLDQSVLFGVLAVGTRSSAHDTRSISSGPR